MKKKIKSIFCLSDAGSTEVVLSFLSLVYYNLGDLIMSEIYLQEAFSLNPKNIFVNERLKEINELIVRSKKTNY